MESESQNKYDDKQWTREDLNLHERLTALPIVDHSKVFVVDASMPDVEEWPDVIDDDQ